MTDLLSNYKAILRILIGCLEKYNEIQEQVDVCVVRWKHGHMTNNQFEVELNGLVGQKRELNKNMRGFMNRINDGLVAGLELDDETRQLYDQVINLF